MIGDHVIIAQTMTALETFLLLQSVVYLRGCGSESLAQNVVAFYLRCENTTVENTDTAILAMRSFLKMTNPCKDCEDRRLGCHSDCEKYLAFYQQNRQKNEKQLAEAHANQYVITAIQKCRSGRSGSWKTYRKVDEK